MAIHVFTDAFVSLNAVDLSDHVKSVTLNYSAELQDSTAMSDTARKRIGGLKDWNLTVEFHQDYAAGEVDASMFAQVGNSIAIILRPTSAAKSPTNPEFTGNAVVESYTPLGGGVGEIHGASVSLQGDGALARATA